MSERRRGLLVVGAALLVVVAVATGLASSALAASSGATRLTVRSTEFGKAVFGPNGKVVYAFGADRGTTSRCYGVCAAAWPPVLTKAPPLAGSGVEAKLLGTTKRKNGTLQVTYGGHPLYYYVADTKPGQLSGQGLNQFGAPWWALSAAGTENHHV